MKTNTSTIHHLSGGMVCISALLLSASMASAQNMFVGLEGSQNTIIQIAPDGSQTPFASGLAYPYALAFNSAGILFEADAGSGNIYKFTGGVRSTFATGLNGPVSLAFDTAGNLFVGTHNNDVLEFAPGGGAPATFASGLNLPAALAFDALGNLYVGNLAGDVAGAGFITKITPGGSPSTFATGLSTPDGLAFNTAGNLFVTGGNFAGTVTKITPEGVESPFAAGLGNPTALAFNSAGMLFVTDGFGAIYEYASDGTRTTFTTAVTDPASIAFPGTLPVPEPAVWSLFGVAMTVLVATRCKYNRVHLVTAGSR